MKTFVIAGASGRGMEMFGKPIAQHFANSAKLVGVYDINPARARYVAQQCGDVPAFTDFDAMLAQTRPSTVIVTTVDRFHHEYIIRALEAGCDAITEKPMTIDDEKVRAILAAEQRTGKTVTVTFNYRYAPYSTRAKELLLEGAIGTPLNVDFHWMLDTRHGADYFRRWHRRMENCGGLLVHKSTHHFDLINWWLADEPERVYAFGKLAFYGPTRAERGERCSTCNHAQTCEFFVDYAHDAKMKALYFDNENEDGYFRDRCVFADEIDIYDTMSATVRYKRGVLLSYSLAAHCPWEGWRAAINGTGGRMELEQIESGPQSGEAQMRIKVFNRKGEVVLYDSVPARGGHGGGDARLLRRLFGGQAMPDPLGHEAGAWAGAMSVLIGVAANQSIRTQQPVAIADLLKGL
jgi:predicted dehydrogenase